MGNILSTSVSGLLAFQQALSVTSNNISNSATPGYSVENIKLGEQPGSGTGGGYFGNGVDVKSVTRSYDEMLAAQVRSSQSSYSSFSTLSTQAAQIDNMLSSSTTGLTVTLQNFVNSLQSLSTAPASTAQRQVVLSKAQALVTQLKSYQSQLSAQSQDLEAQVGSTVTQINTLAKNIALLNGQIAAASGGGQTPNQLMDQRDSLVDQLSQYVSVNAITQSNGEMDIYVGSGQPLVVSGTAQTLVATPNPNDASESNIGIAAGNGTASDITNEINGGTLGGLLTTRSQVLDPTESALGQIAIGIATVMNQQQASGMDLTGAQGTAMFAVGPPQVLPSITNTGSGTVDVTVTDLSQLTPDNYKITASGGAWQLQDTTTGQSVTMTGTGTTADPFQAVGLSIVVNGLPSDGDNYVIKPTAGAVDGMSVLLSSPTQIAAASLGTSAAATGNTGTGTIATPSITDPANWTNGTYSVSFTSATQYQVTDSGGNVVTSGTYTSGSPISFNGEQVSISGAPASGDTFTVGPNNKANTGDNTNVLAMAADMTSSVLDGGTTSLNAAANNLVSATGVLTQQAQANTTAQQSVNQSATNARSNLSGVSLDQEAAKMLQYQQAYQACAQMIQTSQTIFNSLISAITNG
ncbi:MAG: lagellar hook-associated protein 1 FlgK [Gammaproteobacteria bacterium]|nr:lagellar hook-associated protein 1 FlgK [Gammaproteobacteria bacterium]